MANKTLSILKTLWTKRPDGQWGISGIKGIELVPVQNSEPDYFRFESVFQLMQENPNTNIHDTLASFGSTDFLVKQSVLPVVAWMQGDSHIRCIGTASVISCTGLIATAGHVLLDPIERGYGVTGKGSNFKMKETLNFGVFIPTSPAYGRRGFRFFPFEKYWIWGQWQESPLIHEQDKFKLLTDVAICKIAEMPNGGAHQPLGMSTNSFVINETAFALGYAEMDDIPIESIEGELRIPEFQMNLYASVGNIMNVFQENHLRKDVSTPGPCFDFNARIPGKMSGAPVFGADGAVVRGIVSRSFSNERHSFGAMLGPAMHLPLDDAKTIGRTLETLMKNGNEGISLAMGQGL